MTFEVYGLNNIRTFKPQENTLLIRIFDYNKSEYMKKNNPLEFEKEFTSILEYEFNDIDLSHNPLAEDNGKPTEQEVIFQQIINKLKRETQHIIDTRKIENIIIHCHMGERRSVATMFGLRNTLNGLKNDRISMKEMKESFPDYNKYIYNLF